MEAGKWRQFGILNRIIMNKPINSYKEKSISLAEWEKDQWSITKSYKKRDSNEWVNQKIYFFKNELEILQKLINQALGEQVLTPADTANAIDNMPVPDFEDKDLPF